MDNYNTNDNHAKFKKRGTAGIKGIKYQIYLLTMFLLKTMKIFSGWRLSSEDDRAGKFDDVILEWPGGAILVQAKHKETRPVTFKDLLSTSHKNKFSLAKYFLFYQKAKSNYNRVQNVVIITNTNITVDVDNQKFLKIHTVCSNNLLHCQGYNNCFYTFRDEIIPLLKGKVEEYVSINNGKDGIFDENTITEENLKAFLEQLQLYYDYPSDADLYKVIEQLLSRSRACNGIYSRIFPQDIINKITGWYEQTKCTYLTQEYVKTMFSEIRSDKYCQMLDHYNVAFKKDITFDTNHNIFHVVSTKGYFLQVLRVFRAVQNMKMQTLFVNPDDDVEVQKQAIEAFGQSAYEFLVIIWPKITDGAVIQHLCSKLSQTIRNRSYKKVILVAEDNNELLRELEIGNDVYKIDEHITFDNLSVETQKKLSQKRNIIIGNNKLSLAEILGSNNYGKFLAGENLEMLLKGEEIVVKPLRDRDRYYAPLTIPDETICLVSFANKGYINLHTRYIEENNENIVHVNISTKASTMALSLVAKSGELVSAKPDSNAVDVNIGNDAGNTPLHLAAKNNDLDVVRMLLDHGAVVDLENKAGNTALHVASRHGNSDTVKLLLQYGASVNIGNRSGNTPLHLAVREGNFDTVKLLLEPELERTR